VAKIEYASHAYQVAEPGVSTRDVLAVKLRNAPSAIKRRFPTVFPELANGPATTVSPKRSTRWLSTPRGFVVGTLAPGLSQPVKSPRDGETVPEVFSRSAWQGMLANLRRGRRAELRFGHYGNPVASTELGTLRFEDHPVVGLMFEARFDTADPVRSVFFQDVPAGGADVSISFLARDSELVRFQGRTLRLIRSAELRHVAVLLPGSGSVAAYPSAKCVRVAGGDAERLRDAWTAARTRAWEASKHSVRLTDLYPVTL